MLIDIIIHCPGDSTTGIPDLNWTLEDAIESSDDWDRERLREATEEFFEVFITYEPCKVMFSDELEEKLGITT